MNIFTSDRMILKSVSEHYVTNVENFFLEFIL